MDYAVALRVLSLARWAVPALRRRRHGLPLNPRDRINTGADSAFKTAAYFSANPHCQGYAGKIWRCGRRL